MNRRLLRTIALLLTFTLFFPLMEVKAQDSRNNSIIPGLRPDFSPLSEYSMDPPEDTTGEKAVTLSTSKKGPDDFSKYIGKPIVFKDFEVTVTSIKRSKTFEDKEALLIIYNFKNTGDKTVSASTAVDIKVFQNKVELSIGFSKDYSDQAYKEVKKGGEVKGCQILLEGVPEDGDLEIDIAPWLDFENNNVRTYTMKYPEK